MTIEELRQQNVQMRFSFLGVILLFYSFVLTSSVPILLCVCALLVFRVFMWEYISKRATELGYRFTMDGRLIKLSPLLTGR